MSRKCLYFDNNATTFMNKTVRSTYDKWSSSFNPATSSKEGSLAMKAITASKKYFCRLLFGNSGNNHKIVFTSGASESNCTIMRSATRSFKKITGYKPHLIVSAIEHKSVLQCAQSLVDHDEADITIVPATIDGYVDIKNIDKAIKKNTCLAVIMHGNNETGAVNDIKTISKILHKRNIPLHVDMVQTFGKTTLNLMDIGADSAAISFHKIQGPKSAGLLAIRNSFYKGYQLSGIISGTQQDGFRGGTENVALVAASTVATKIAKKARVTKNKRLLRLITMFIDGVNKIFKKTNDFELTLIGPSLKDNRLPHVVLVAVTYKKPGRKKLFCNVKFKHLLEKNGIIVGIGSACNTSSGSASHVLYAMGYGNNKLIKKGVIRISLCDDTTIKDVNKLIKTFTSTSYLVI